MAKGQFFHDRRFEGVTNKEIIKIQNEIREIQTDYERKLKEKKSILKQIQENCDHEYLFCSKGMYEDSYECHLCGHEKEH